MSHLGAIFMALLFCLSCEWENRSFGHTEKENRMPIDGSIWTVAVADTSLYIPGFDEQPISVTAVGVGPDGRTTWRIQPGRPTGTIPAAPFPITGKFVIPRPSLTPTDDVHPLHWWVGCFRSTVRDSGRFQLSFPLSCSHDGPRPFRCGGICFPSSAGNKPLVRD